MCIFVKTFYNQSAEQEQRNMSSYNAEIINNNTARAQKSDTITFLFSDSVKYYKSAELVEPDLLIFSELEYELHTVKKAENSVQDYSWDFIVTGLTLAGFILLALIRNLFNIRLWQPFVAMLSIKPETSEEKKSNYGIFVFLSYSVFFLSVFLLCIQLIKNFIFFENFNFYILSIIVAAWLIGSVFLLKGVNLIFTYIFTDKIYKLYSRAMESQITGISIPLFLLVSIYLLLPENSNHIVPYVIFTMLIISYLLKLLKFVYINYLHKVRFYYLFLYLCSLEIIPLLIIYRVFLAE